MTALQTAPPRAQTTIRPIRKQPTVKNLGANIKAARTARGYSQGDLSLMLGYAKQTISQWETGECTPTIDSLVRLATILNVDPVHFLTGLSEDLELTPDAQRRLDIASQVIPLYVMDVAGGILMQRIDPKTVEAKRHVATLQRHPPRSIAFTVTGDAMVSSQPGPSFCSGDVVTLAPATMAKRGQIVFATVDGQFVFRRFLPKIDDSVEGAILRALNPDFQDIVMAAGDAILGALREHIRHY